MTEQQIQQAIRLDLGREPDVVLWRNSTGATTIGDEVVEKFLRFFPLFAFARVAIAAFVNWLNRTRTQRFGLCVGSADLVGIGPGGRFLALEVKTPTGPVSPEQSRFLTLVNLRGGIAAVVRSPEQARAVIVRARGDL